MQEGRIPQYNLVLASKSPRRKELLSYLGIPYQICPAQIEEHGRYDSPEQMASMIAEQKGRAVFDLLREQKNMHDLLVVSADTIVIMDGKIFHKPTNVTEAGQTLQALSGRTHQVYTGVSIISSCSALPEKKATTFFCKTDVKFDHLSNELLEDYLATNESLDKAGAYGIQGPALTFVANVNGSYSNVVGFPLSHFIKHLREHLQTSSYKTANIKDFFFS